MRTRNNNGALQVWDPIRRQWIALTAEEHVRQSLLAYLIEEMHYPPALMAVEKGLSYGHTTLRFDLVIYTRESTEPWMLVECKAPEVMVTDTALHQLLQYQSKVPTCRYWLLTNGHQSFCADAYDTFNIKWLNSLPAY